MCIKHDESQFQLLYLFSVTFCRWIVVNKVVFPCNVSIILAQLLSDDCAQLIHTTADNKTRHQICFPLKT
jgi:hypothetical protein